MPHHSQTYLASFASLLVPELPQGVVPAWRAGLRYVSGRSGTPLVRDDRGVGVYQSGIVTSGKVPNNCFLCSHPRDTLFRVRLFDEQVEPRPSSGDLYSSWGLRRLLSLPSVGPSRARALAEHFHRWSALAEATEAEMCEVLGAAGRAAHKGVDNAVEPAPIPEGITVIGAYDPEWPEWMSVVRDAPVVIYVRGSLPSGRRIAIVGTRKPTQFGESVVRKTVAEAASRGFGVVSGLALGIDSLAHSAALEESSPTWAILGGGVDAPTPASNRELAERIVAEGGGLISEQPPGTDPNAQRLVARNRLQAASSDAVVVAQCGIPSGTLHTARFALVQGRPLVVPRPRAPWDDEPQSAGNMALTDPLGCSPSVVQASGRQASLLAGRRPLADVVVHTAEDLSAIWGDQ